MGLNYVLILVQLMCAVVVCIYFFNQNKAQGRTRSVIEKNSTRELDKLRAMRARTLTQPLSEKARPSSMRDIVGQEEGIRALKAALCGPNPQHVIIYGPPGIGKTCAARLVLDEAKKNKASPFRSDAAFIEVDATCVRFDERSIADPLIGSVHDPIYQGAGAYGQAGVPQPKLGAVTKANGGVLFLDEMGELHPTQMNKLLKVLEDRKVMLESAYYMPDDTNIPAHIHDIFTNGLPADFRLVGATTRQPQEISSAIRSRCIEVFFRALKPDELVKIALGAAKKCAIELSEHTAYQCARYSENGRDVVNLIQLAAGLAINEERNIITSEDVAWVAETCRFRPRLERHLSRGNAVGTACALAVTTDGIGVVLEVEVLSQIGTGKLNVTGIIEEEELTSGGRKISRRSTARSSVETVLSALKATGVNAQLYDMHINFPGGVPIDGTSAGAAIAAAVYSSVKNKPIATLCALTGEISIRGLVKPVGGVKAKIEAAVQAGATRVLIPHENFRESYTQLGAEVIGVKTLSEIIELTFEERFKVTEAVVIPVAAQPEAVLAKGEHSASKQS